MNEDNDHEDKMKRFISANYDNDYRMSGGAGHYINATERYTDITNGRGLSQQIASVDASPNPFKYRDNKENLGDLSPFGGMRRRPFSERTFGKMEQGSIRGSIFALCAVAIGAGVLSLPYVLRINGLILGTALIIVGAISGYYSMQMILIRSLDTGAKNFSELAKLAGGKALTILLQISILSFMFGACVSY